VVEYELVIVTFYGFKVPQNSLQCITIKWLGQMLFFDWKYIRNMKMKICPKCFLPKSEFCKIGPGISTSASGGVEKLPFGLKVVSSKLVNPPPRDFTGPA
jgi:hypothetical protein